MFKLLPDELAQTSAKMEALRQNSIEDERREFLLTELFAVRQIPKAKLDSYFEKKLFFTNCF